VSAALRRLTRARAFPAAAALLALLAWNALSQPRFLGVLVDVLHRGTPVLLLSLGQALVLATGGVDLSVGAVMALSSSTAAVLLTQTGLPAGAVIAIALAVGLALGLWNGALVAALRIQPIVATLVLLTAGRGIAQLLSGGGILTFRRPDFGALATGSLLGVPATLLLVVALYGMVGFLARGTTLGFHLEAVGSNARAARLSGLRVGRIQILAYALCGVLAALAGLVVCADVGAADASHVGLYFELDAILAAVIGGTALTGGRLCVAGALLGALANQALSTTLLLEGLGTETALCVKAAAVLFVVALQHSALRTAEARA
jgi:ribose/xylose/arabinose/galactoside ABC-type transport system permease subunit